MKFWPFSIFRRESRLSEPTPKPVAEGSWAAQSRRRIAELREDRDLWRDRALRAERKLRGAVGPEASKCERCPACAGAGVQWVRFETRDFQGRIVAVEIRQRQCPECVMAGRVPVLPAESIITPGGRGE